jgi:hypothetical protein
VRAQFIYEKFTEDSDPIKDLKIGVDPDTFEGYLKIAGYKNIEIEKPQAFDTRLLVVLFSKNNYEFKFEVDRAYSKSGMRGFYGFKPWMYWKKKNEKYFHVLTYPYPRKLKSTEEKDMVKVLKLKLIQIQEFLK